MAGFGDYETAMKARDVIASLVVTVVDQERPRYRYASVISIDPDGRTATVRFPGGATDGSNDISVKIGSILPTGPGQTVRVEGYAGDKFISDVMGVAGLTTTTAADLPIPTGVVLTSGIGVVSAHWDDMNTSDHPIAGYEIQFAESADFVTNMEDYTTSSRLFNKPYAAGTEVWVRVRTYNGTGGFSAWKPSTPASVIVPASSGSTDGNVPPIGPMPEVIEGLGYLGLQWALISNADPVTYEVNISTTDGFTPDATTYLGETTGNVFFIDAMPDDTKLVYGTTYFVRIVPRDDDGPGPAGPQGSGSPQQVELGDIGNVPNTQISDGAAPTVSPAGPTIKNGIGFLYLKWDHISNPDAVTYEVHISTVSGFIPDANSYVMETPANFALVRTEGVGATPTYKPLVYGTTYYLKLWAKDTDGYAPNAGSQASGATVQANTPDIAVGAITAASAIIADAAIATAKIQDAAIVTAKIADLNVNNAKIANLSVSDAKISDLNVAKITAGSLIADVTLSARIKTANTGQRTELNSTGLQCYDSSGSLTVSIQAGAATITAGTFQTGTSGAYWKITSGTANQLQAYSGYPSEVGPAILQVVPQSVGFSHGTVSRDTTFPALGIFAPSVSSVYDPASIVLGHTKVGAIIITPAVMLTVSDTSGTLYAATFTRYEFSTAALTAQSLGAQSIQGADGGSISVRSTLLPSGAWDLGSLGARWNNVYAANLGANGAMTSSGTFAHTGTTATFTGSGLFSVNAGAGVRLTVGAQPIGGSVVAATVNTGNWQIGYNSSSARYKRDVEPASFDLKALKKLRVVNFRSKTDLTDETVYTGLIAEEVAAIPEMRWLALYAPDKRGRMRPEGVDYEKLSLVLLHAVRDLDNRLSKLEIA